MRRLVIILVSSVLILAAAIGGVGYWLLSGDGIRLALEQQGAQRLGMPVHIGSVAAQFYPRIGVHLKAVTLGEPVRVTLTSVAVSTGLRALLSRRIENAEIAITDSRINLPLSLSPSPESASSASSAAERNDAGSTPSSLTVVSVRNISLRNVTLVSRGREVEISAQSSLTANTLTLSSLSVTAAGTNIAAHGTVTVAPAIDADITASADRLNLDDLLALAGAFSTTPTASQRATSAPAFSGRVTARVTAERATASGLDLQGLSTTIRVVGPRLSLSPTTFRLFGGRYDGDLDVDVREDSSIAITSRFTALDVAQIASFGGAPDSMTGRLSATSTLTGRGRDFSSILASARGTGNVSITDGTIRRLDLVRTVVVFFGRPSPASPPASDAFSRLDAQISLRDRVITADALSLQSPDADMAGQGTLTLDTRALNAHLDLSLSEALSKEAGTDLARYTRDGNRIVLPARLTGTLEGPKISIDAAAALKRGLRNEVNRRLGGLLGRFTRP